LGAPACRYRHPPIDRLEFTTYLTGWKHWVALRYYVAYCYLAAVDGTQRQAPWEENGNRWRGDATDVAAVRQPFRIDTKIEIARHVRANHDRSRRVMLFIGAAPILVLAMAAPVITTTSGRIWFDDTDLYLDRGRMRATRKRGADRHGCPEVAERRLPRCQPGAAGSAGRASTIATSCVGDVDLSWRCVEAGRPQVVRQATAAHDEEGHPGGPGWRTDPVRRPSTTTTPATA
jgi:hypothetical protein